MTASLVAGEVSICHQVKIPASLDRKLRARALLEGDVAISRVIRAALEAHLASEPPRHLGTRTLADRCPDCDLSLAPELEDAEETSQLCWRRWHGDVCQGRPVDWRSRALVAETKVGAADVLVADILHLIKTAQGKIT
jgi:hypothetical protein